MLRLQHSPTIGQTPFSIANCGDCLNLFGESRSGARMPQKDDGKIGGKIKISRRIFVAAAAIAGADVGMLGFSLQSRVESSSRLSLGDPAKYRSEENNAMNQNRNLGDEIVKEKIR